GRGDRAGARGGDARSRRRRGLMEIAVDCRKADDGWHGDVPVGSAPGATSHVVTVNAPTMERLGSADADPTRLVAESFRYLLEQEPRESILRTFDLTVIGRYFPAWA